MSSRDSIEMLRGFDSRRLHLLSALRLAASVLLDHVSARGDGASVDRESHACDEPGFRWCKEGAADAISSTVPKRASTTPAWRNAPRS